MAKMFYTLDEAAEKLGKSPDEVRAMADDGQLKIFRDGDKLMFKRDEVDTQAGGTARISIGGDQVDLRSASRSGSGADTRAATGISVFDSGEIRAADSMAQTQATSSVRVKDEDLALESVGSGSGLLDLTRETDDTSLGAELLDEIYPGNKSATDSEMKMDTAAIGSTGIFDTGSRPQEASAASGFGTSASSFSSGSGAASGTATPNFNSGELAFDSGVSAKGSATEEAISGRSGSAAAFSAGASSSPSSLQMSAQMGSPEESDPAGSLLTTLGLAIPVILVSLGILAVIPAMHGQVGKMGDALGKGNYPLIIFGAGLVLSVIMAVVGMLVGRSQANRA